MNSQFPLFVRFSKKIGIQPDKLLYFCSDLFVLACSGLCAFFIRASFFPFSHGAADYSKMLILFFFAPFALGLPLGLYRGMPQPRHVELRQLVTFTTMTYAIAAAILFLSKSGEMHSRGIFVSAWVLACISLPLARHLIRARCCRYSWWGYPLVILDTSTDGKKLWHYLRRHPGYGFNPVELLSVPRKTEEAKAALRDASRRHRGSVALFIMNSTWAPDMLSVLNIFFPRILVVPASAAGKKKFWFSTCDMGATIAFLVQQRLHDKRRLALKRAMDLLLCLLGSVFVLPLTVLLAVAIRLDSRGPVLYTQKRLGRGGCVIRVHKFRTMAENADEILEEYLASSPELREEWNRDHKLRRDPRVTRVGRFLRMTSLDELPQLLDVILGTMSIVGPRPIVADEIAKYGTVYEDYMLVRPGITGLWQISGRSDTTYEERVNYDFYYINNWSIWLDIWILCKTVPVVLFGKGAY